MHWTRKTIIDHIQHLHHQGEELNYTSAERNHLNLVRAAGWHFGTWRRAVESAGIDYESLSKYRRWNRERIVARIQELHAQGADLSWRAVSTEVDPPLAAAALRANGFPSWREAVEAAGFSIDDVARYKYWDNERVIAAILELKEQGHPLSSKAMQSSDQSLFCAARRRFGSWDGALIAAGLDAGDIRLRRPKKPRKKVAKPAEKTTAKVAQNGHLNGYSIGKPATKAPVSKAPAVKVPAAKTPPAKVAAKATPAKAVPAKNSVKATATKTPVAKAPSAKAPTAKASASKAPAAKTPAVKAPAKQARRVTFAKTARR